MSEHSPWLLGYWERTLIGRKDYFVFHEDPTCSEEATEIFRGVKEGDRIHCSKFPKTVTSVDPHLVLGLAGEQDYMGFYTDDNSILRRIVACVNACKGLSTAGLEEFSQNASLKDLLLDVDRARGQSREEGSCPWCSHDDSNKHESDCPLISLLQKPVVDAPREQEPTDV